MDSNSNGWLEDISNNLDEIRKELRLSNQLKLLALDDQISNLGLGATQWLSIREHVLRTIKSYGIPVEEGVE